MMEVLTQPIRKSSTGPGILSRPQISRHFPARRPRPDLFGPACHWTHSHPVIPTEPEHDAEGWCRRRGGHWGILRLRHPAFDPRILRAPTDSVSYSPTPLQVATTICRSYEPRRVPEGARLPGLQPQLGSPSLGAILEFYRGRRRGLAELRAGRYGNAGW